MTNMTSFVKNSWLCTLVLLLAADAYGQPVDSYGDPLPEGAVDRLGTQRMRYDIEDVAYSKGGTHALVIAENELHAWNLARGERTGDWTISEHDLHTIDLDETRTKALISDGAGTIYEWDLENNRAIGQFQTVETGTDRRFTSVRYSPDMSRVLTLDGSGNLLEVWERTSGRRLHRVELPGQTDYDEAVWGPEGRTAFIAKSPHPNIVRYDLETGQEIAQFLENYIAYDIDLSSDGTRLLVGSRLTASEWNVATHEQLHEIGYRVHSGYAVPSAAYAEEGNYVITGSRDGSLRLWDEERESVTMHWFPHQEAVRMIRLSPDGQWVLSYGSDDLLTETSIETGERRLDWPRHFSAVNAIASAPDDARYFTGSSDGTIRIWDAKTGESTGMIENPGREVHALAVSSDGMLLAAGSKDGTVRIFDSTTGDLKQTLEGHRGYVRAAVFLQDGRLLTAADDGSLMLWAPEKGKSLRRLGGELDSGHRGGVLDVVLLPGEGQALSAGRDGTIRLWDLETGTQQRAIMAHRGKAESVDVSADGKRAISGGGDGVVVEWNLEEGTVERELEHGSWITDVVYLPGERQIASADRSGDIKRWSRASGEIVEQLTGHNDDVEALTVSNQLLLSGSEDTTVLIWNLSSAGN